MMLFPTEIRLISLPSVIFLTLFGTMGVLTLGVALRLKLRTQKRASFFWIAFTALAMGLYSLTILLLYSAPSFDAVSFWQRMRWVALVLVFVFFIYFSISHLKLGSDYWTRWLPMASLVFLPLLAVREWALRPGLSPKTFSVGPYSTRVLEYEAGFVVLALFAWLACNMLLMSRSWFRFYRVEKVEWGILISFVLFFAAALNDLLVAAGFYKFYYLLELGFVGFVFSMGYEVIREYIKTTQALALKSQQVDALNEEMRFLISSISHDLKSPLLSIQGFTESLRDAFPASSAQAGAVGKIQRNASHMREMLDSLLQFMEAGHVDLSVSPIDLESLGAEVLWVLEGEGLPARSRVQYPEAWSRLVSSERAVRHILLNLLHNAFKYGRAADTGVSLDCHPHEDGVLISVRDQGPGIAEELRRKIFEPFFRLDSRTPGTGMGLAIAKRLAETFGGDIWLDSDYREGARFCVYLPSQEG